MMAFFTEPRNILAMLGILGWIIAGGFAVMGFLNKSARERRKENDDVATNLINNLKGTVDELKSENCELNKKREAQNEKIAHLEGQCTTLERILQGRNPEQVAFFKESPALLEMAKETHALVKSNAECIKTMGKAMTDLLQIISQRSGASARQ